MTTFTPGEWRQTATIIHSENGVICQLSEPRWSKFVEHRRVGMGSPDWDEAMANARLITAAPDLLAACEAVLYTLNINGLEYSETYDQIVYAIAKARGDE